MTFNRNQKGYTFIELLVTISIISLIAGISVYGFVRERKERALNVSSYRLLQDLRMVQDKSLAPAGEYILIEFSEGDENYLISSREDDELEEIEEGIGLEDGIEIANDLKLIFKPPHPTIYIEDSLGNRNELIGRYEDIGVRIKGDHGRFETVRIHGSGLIEILR